MGGTLPSPRYKSAEYLATTRQWHYSTDTHSSKSDQETPPTMISSHLYNAVAYAYDDIDQDTPQQLQVFDNPQDTVNHTREVLQRAVRVHKVFKWQTYFYLGEAMHRYMMIHPGTTYAQSGTSLGLKRCQRDIGAMIYMLFRDNYVALNNFVGFKEGELAKLPAEVFDDTLKQLQCVYPVPESEYVEFDFEV